MLRVRLCIVLLALTTLPSLSFAQEESLKESLRQGYAQIQGLNAAAAALLAGLFLASALFGKFGFPKGKDIVYLIGLSIFLCGVAAGFTVYAFVLQG